MLRYAYSARWQDESGMLLDVSNRMCDYQHFRRRGTPG